MSIVPFQSDLVPAVEAFNQRLEAGGSEHQFPTRLTMDCWPGEGATRDPDEAALRLDRSGFIWFERYLLLQGSEAALPDRPAVRGAYILIRQRAIVSGEVREVQFLKLPVSEGIVNPKFSMVGVALLCDAFKRAPNMFALGMGNLQNPLPRLLETLGARLRPVPFLFRVLRASRFLRHIQPLRSTPGRARLLDFAARMHLGDIPLAAYNHWQSRRRPATSALRAEVVPGFGAWADDLWSRHKQHFSFACCRAAGESNHRFPAHDTRLVRLAVRLGDRVIGWAALTDSQFEHNKFFGAMRVGAIADCMAEPGQEAAVAWLASQHLEERGLDLIVTNQGHRGWRNALLDCGFREGPSNFILATPPGLEKRIAAGDPAFERVHINRGDGDGPIHL